jgi:hypothetical protein
MNVNECLETGTLVTHTAAGSGTTTSGDLDATRHRGILLYIYVSAITGTSPTLTVTIQGKSPGSGQYHTILASAAISATGLTVLRVYPGLTAAANTVANDALPCTYRLQSVIGGTTPAVTAQITGVLVY